MTASKEDFTKKISEMDKENYKKFASKARSALLSDIPTNAAPSMFRGNTKAVEIGECARTVSLSLEAHAPEGAKSSAIEAIYTQFTKKNCPNLMALVNETMTPLRTLPVNA